jgi:elongation factor G
MKEYPTEKIRNLALLGHGGTGKTSLAEAVLFTAGAINRLGRVDDGTTTSDFDPDEVKRKVSINVSLLPCEWAGHKLNVIDAPGYADFIGDAYSGLAATDVAVIVVCAASGVQVGTEAAWKLAEQRGLARAVFMSRLDRENASFEETLRQVQGMLSRKCVPVQLPIGSEHSFAGVVDLIEAKAYMGEKGTEGPPPAEMADAIAKAREQLVEAVAEVDDELVNKYLEGEALSEEEIRDALRKGIASGEIVPVFAGSGTKTIGVASFLNAVAVSFPTPRERRTEARDASGNAVEVTADPAGPLAALVFKTTADPFVGKLTYLRVFSGTLTADSQVWNSVKGVAERIGQLYVVRGKTQEPVPRLVAGDIGAVAKLSETVTNDTLCGRDRPLVIAPIEFPAPVFSAAVHPRSKADTDKMSTALARIVEEDPILRVRREQDTGETIISGLGESHIETACEKMRRKFGADVLLTTPKVPYKETITTASSAEHTHKKQTGGHGQYARVTLEVEPLPRGSGFEFENKIVGGVVPKQYVPAVEDGVREALSEGVLAHYPMVDLRVKLVDGKDHPVDSSEMSFKLAGSQAVKAAAQKARPVLLEPIVNLRLRAPEAYTGDLVSDLNGRRAKVLGISPDGGMTVIDAQAPLAEVQRYSTDLRSLTQGRAAFEMSFDHYEEVPDHLTKRVIEQSEKERAER